MKKVLTIMMAFLTLTLTSFAGGHHHSKPVFQESVTYKTYQDKGLPFELILGKSEGKPLLYIPGWGRIFLKESKLGYQDINNNFNVRKMENGHIQISANVTMVDLNYTHPDKYKKGEFYHSLTGYLHSHVYPMLDKKVIKVGKTEYSVVETHDDFGGSTLYTEKNGKFTFLVLKKWDKMPDLAEFKFVAELAPIK